MVLDKIREFFRTKRKELALLAVSTLLSLGFSIPAYSYIAKIRNLQSIRASRTAYESAQNGTLEDGMKELMRDDALILGLRRGDLRLSEDYRRVYEFTPKLSFGKTLNASNWWGYRDYDYNKTKPENTFRVGIFGDSFTDCWGISDNFQSYPKILEVMVNHVPNLSKYYQFLNLGCTGYNTLAEVSLFLKESRRFDLDMAVLQFLDNDRDHINGQCDSDIYSEEAVMNLSKVMGEGNPKFWGFFDELLGRMTKVADEENIDLYLLSHYYSHYLKVGKRPPENIRAIEIARGKHFGIIDIWQSFQESTSLYEQETPVYSEEYKGINFLKVSKSDCHPSTLSNERAALYILKHVLPSIPEEDRDKIRDFYFNGGYRRHFQPYDARRMLPSLPKRHLDEINGSMKERLEDYFKAVSN